MSLMLIELSSCNCSRDFSKVSSVTPANESKIIPNQKKSCRSFPKIRGTTISETYASQECED